VHENILTIILLNETIALLATEPLDGSFCHSAYLPSKIFFAVRINALAEKKRLLQLGVTALIVSILSFPKNCQSKLAEALIDRPYQIVKLIL
jgi:hypothetical protein